MAYIYDGQQYGDPSEFPDLGSIECVGVKGNQRSYFGFIQDEALLPKYKDLASGSDATLVDPAGGGTIVKYYHAPTKEWYRL